MLLLLLTGFPTGKCLLGNTGGISVCYKRVLWQVIYENYDVYRKGIFGFSQVTHMVANLAIPTRFAVNSARMGMATFRLPYGSLGWSRLGADLEWYFPWICNAVSCVAPQYLCHGLINLLDWLIFRSTALWPLLIGILLPLKLSVGCGFSSTLILVNNSVPNDFLGSVNGLAMTASSISR